MIHQFKFIEVEQQRTNSMSSVIMNTIIYYNKKDVNKSKTLVQSVVLFSQGFRI